MRGLLVEDEKVLQKIHSFYLESLGYSFDLAKNGKETLNYLNKSNYDFMLLDNGLPDIQGIEICKKIRKNQKTGKQSSFPIIFVTANSSFRQDCLDAGCDDIVVKPTSQETLGQLIKYWIHQYQQNTINNS